VAVRRRVGVDEGGMLFGIPRVQLQEELAVAEQPIVDVAVWVVGVDRIRRRTNIAFSAAFIPSWAREGETQWPRDLQA
jgi:hypothetical protein